MNFKKKRIGYKLTHTEFINPFFILLILVSCSAPPSINDIIRSSRYLNRDFESDNNLVLVFFNMPSCSNCSAKLLTPLSSIQKKYNIHDGNTFFVVDYSREIERKGIITMIESLNHKETKVIKYVLIKKQIDKFLSKTKNNESNIFLFVLDSKSNLIHWE